MLLRHGALANHRGRGLNSASNNKKQLGHRKVLATLRGSSATKRFLWIVLAMASTYVFFVMPFSSSAWNTHQPKTKDDVRASSTRLRAVLEDKISERQQNIHFTGMTPKKFNEATAVLEPEDIDGVDQTLGHNDGLDTSEWVQHSLKKGPEGEFRVMGAYGIDGDPARPIESAETSGLLVVVVGSGHLMANAEKITNEMKQPRRDLPVGLSCDFSTSSGVSWSDPAVVHINGTEYAKAINRFGSYRHRGEISMWISCDVSEHMRGSTTAETLTVVISDDVKHGGTGSIQTAPMTVNWFLSEKYSDGPEHALVHCSAAIYGMTGTQWLTEWIGYHIVMGFAHMHVYIFEPSPSVIRVVNAFRAQGVLTAHLWAHEFVISSHGALNWEHAQRLARNDCYLRNRGRAGYVLFTDADEVIAPDATAVASIAISAYQASARTEATLLAPRGLVRWAEAQYKASSGHVYGFSISSITVPPLPASEFKDKWPNPDVDVVISNEILNNEALRKASGNSAGTSVQGAVQGPSANLILGEIQVAERKCHRPYNCGEFHSGRQKVLLRTAFGTPNPNVPLFYHAVSTDYELSKRIMMQIPLTHMYLRHYAGHFKHTRMGGLSKEEGRLLPLDRGVLRRLGVLIKRDKTLLDLYLNSPDEVFLGLNNFHDVWRFAKLKDPKQRPDEPEEDKPIESEDGLTDSEDGLND